MQRIMTVLICFFFSSAIFTVQGVASDSPIKLPLLEDKARIIRDINGIAHIKAKNEHDLFFLQGYVHAQDRLFQMDVSRRQASGTLAELFGPGVLASDVQLRTLGLRRAAERSLEVHSQRVLTVLEAYSAGVNAFVATSVLPPEYEVLELAQFEPWTPLDCLVVVKLIGFGFSFDVDIEPTMVLSAYREAGIALGFDGTALYFEDLFRSAPFDPASTVPDSLAANVTFTKARARVRGKASSPPPPAPMIDLATVELGKQYLEKIKSLRIFQSVLESDRRGGSNAWAIRGVHSASDVPLIANDPHFFITFPSPIYPIHIKVRSGNEDEDDDNSDDDDDGNNDNAKKINVIGSSIPGFPFVVFGHNRHISWGSTVNRVDVTDTFQEQIAPDPSSPSGLSIVHQGQLEHIIPIPQVFRQNNLNGVIDDISVVPPGGSIPPATLVVPRRNQGPILQLDLENGIALSIQYTGFSATPDLEAFLIWNEAKDLKDFIEGVQFLETGSFNWIYADNKGNIAYFANGEVPIREDLQTGTVNGLPPFFIRNGTGGNEWLPVQNPQPNQSIEFEILPFSEMPHIINPPAGYLVNANNDPIGTTLDNDPLNQLRPGGGIFYLNPHYSFFRATRINEMIKQRLSTDRGKISFEDMQEMQSDTVMLDAQVFVPRILDALARAQAEDADPLLASLGINVAVASAVNRLADWDFSTPTGIPEGYDASDMDGNLSSPSDDEIAASVAATIYSVWRGQFIRNTIDAQLVPFGLPTPDSDRALSALRNLLDNFTTNGGVGTSGINFFNVPDVPNAADRRDILILQSILDALDLLASDEFTLAFANSTNQEDYRWGKLHRFVLPHPLGEPFSVPPAGGAFPQPLSGLPGIPTDGGFGTVDRTRHDARADSVNSFMFGLAPAKRFAAATKPHGISGVSSLIGGISGILGNPQYVNLLPDWLTDEAFQMLFRNEDIKENSASVTKFVPAN